MLYTTGDGQWRRLYYVEFDGVTPQAPILLSGDAGAEQAAFGFMSEDRCWYLAGDDLESMQAVMIVDFGAGPPEAVQVSEPLDPGHKIFGYTFGAGQTKIAYAVTGMQHTWLSLLDLSVEQPTPQQIYAAPYMNEYILAAVPTFGQIMPFTAPTGSDDRHIFAVDLGDPELPITQLDAELPDGWIQPLTVRLTPDESQVLFRTGPEGAEGGVLMRVPVDGSGPVQQVTALGWALGAFTVMAPE
jgi:hypothetical protein